MFKRHLPITVALSGAVSFITGLSLGRVDLQPPGGSSLSALTWDQQCRAVHAVFGGRVGETPLCQDAHAMVLAAGLLIILGGAGIVTSIVLGIRRSRRHASVIVPENSADLEGV